MAGDAGDPLVVVKQQLLEELAPLMPDLSEDATVKVPVTYHWPGNRKRAEHVWFNGGRSSVGIPTYKSGRKRRQYDTTFEVIVEAQRSGDQVDENDQTVLQLEVDQAVEAIVLVIDEWLADNPTVAIESVPPRTVDKVQLTNIDRQHGPFDVGVISRAVLTISYSARAL